MMKKKRTKGRWARFLCAAILSAAIGMMSGTLPAYAIQHIPVDKEDCSIELDLKYKDAATDTEHQLADGKVSIYQVATVKIDNGYVFDLTGGAFKDLTDEQVQSIPTMDSAALESANPELSAKLSDAAAKSAIDPLKTADVVNGAVKFSGLKPGLYLIEQSVKSSDHAEFNPFLITIPDADNSYEVKAEPKATIYAACKEDPPIQKIVQGTTGTNDKFTFRMTADDPSYPMPEGTVDGVKTITVTGPGSYEFGWMYFDHAGEYTYTVQELPGEDSNYTYDTAPFKKTTIVEEKDGSLVIAKAYYTRDGVDSAVATFTNTYGHDTPPGGGGNPPGGGRRRRETPPPTVPDTPGEVLGATRDVGRGVLGAVREPQVLGAVRTGDTNALIIWATILVLAVSGFAGWISIYYRKKSTRLP